LNLVHQVVVHRVATRFDVFCRHLHLVRLLHGRLLQLRRTRCNTHTSAAATDTADVTRRREARRRIFSTKNCCSMSTPIVIVAMGAELAAPPLGPAL
jgi:hypothetical protein